MSTIKLKNAPKLKMDTLDALYIMGHPSLDTKAHGISRYTKKVKVKVKFTLEQATKAQRESRGIALLFL
jgi:hypothetical protein